MSPITIITAANANYVPHVAAMLHSLFTHNPDESFVITFLHRADLEAVCRNQLAALCSRSNAEFHAVQVSASLLNGLPLSKSYPEEAWYRVILPDLLPQLGRVLWLDADVIVLKPIRALWETNLEGKLLAACPNALLYKDLRRIGKMGISDRSRYFNTGVLLLDLGGMRTEGSVTLLREAAVRHRAWIRNADQDVLNPVFHMRYRRLPLYWNVLTSSYFNVAETVSVHGMAEYKEALRAPRIVHFTGNAAGRPWEYRCAHPYRDTYLRHRAEAGWPAPIFGDKSVKHFIARNTPLRLRALVNKLRKRRYGEFIAYVRR